MKSHVREGRERQLFEQHMHMVTRDENGAIYTVSEQVEEVLRRQAPEIKFRNWYCSKEGNWLVTAIKGEKTEVIHGKDIGDCVENAKKMFLENNE